MRFFLGFQDRRFKYVPESWISSNNLSRNLHIRG